MKKQFISQPIALLSGWLLVIPSLYFILSALLNYEFGIPGLWSSIESIFEKPGNKQLGLNINLLILFGPLVAILINLTQVMNVVFKKDISSFNLEVELKRYSSNWMVIAAGSLCLASLFLYLLGENFNC
jgi:hypothetical protein